MRTARIAPLLALLAGACAPDDDCAAMCEAARARFEGCLDEAGLGWGAEVGYTDADDYDDWCATWSWEARQLGTADTCTDRLAVFSDGTCDDYYAAWGSE